MDGWDNYGAEPAPASNSSGEGLLAKWKKEDDVHGGTCTNPEMCCHGVCADELEATLRAIRAETVEKWREAAKHESRNLVKHALLSSANELDTVLKKRIGESK